MGEILDQAAPDSASWGEAELFQPGSKDTSVWTGVWQYNKNNLRSGIAQVYLNDAQNHNVRSGLLG